MTLILHIQLFICIPSLTVFVKIFYLVIYRTKLLLNLHQNCMDAFYIQCKIQLKVNYFVAVCSFCCYLAYSSIGKNLVSYLTKVLHETNVAAARNVATWQGTSYLAPLVGAFVADSYLGKYRTSLISCTIFLIVSATNDSCQFMI